MFTHLSRLVVQCGLVVGAAGCSAVHLLRRDIVVHDDLSLFHRVRWGSWRVEALRSGWWPLASSSSTATVRTEVFIASRSWVDPSLVHWGTCNPNNRCHI